MEKEKKQEEELERCDLFDGWEDTSCMIVSISVVAIILGVCNYIVIPVSKMIWALITV